VMHALIGHWRSMGIHCENHVDDFWIAYPNREILIYQRDNIIAKDLTKGGLVLSNKGTWDPTQEPKFYGLILDTKRAQVIIPDEKLVKAKRALQTLATRTMLLVRLLA
ncbi:8979_t:CDS:1, partial [Cetraspora pellucida]